MFTYADAVKNSKEIAVGDPSPAKTSCMPPSPSPTTIAAHPTAYATTIPATTLPRRMVKSPQPSKEWAAVSPRRRLPIFKHLEVKAELDSNISGGNVVPVPATSIKDNAPVGMPSTTVADSITTTTSISYAEKEEEKRHSIKRQKTDLPLLPLFNHLDNVDNAVDFKGLCVPVGTDNKEESVRKTSSKGGKESSNAKAGKESSAGNTSNINIPSPPSTTTDYDSNEWGSGSSSACRRTRRTRRQLGTTAKITDADTDAEWGCSVDIIPSSGGASKGGGSGKGIGENSGVIVSSSKRDKEYNTAAHTPSRLRTSSGGKKGAGSDNWRMASGCGGTSFFASTKSAPSTSGGISKENIPLVSSAAVSKAASYYDSDDDSDADDDSVVFVKVVRNPGVHKTTSFSSSIKDPSTKSILAACDTRLDELIATWRLSPEKQGLLLRFPEVVEYAKKCLRAICPGSRKFILQLKCPVPKKNHNGENISLALGGNCPDDMRHRICSIRCADELFGIELLSQLFVFNCRVECRIDCKSGRCAACSWDEAEALGNVYQVLCVYAHAVGAKMGFISLAGTTTGIGHKLGKNFFEKMTHGDGTPYISEGMYVPNGYHISLGAYYCNRFPTVEMQVRRFTNMVKNISVALGDPDIYTNALSNRLLPFVREWDLMSEEKTEITEFWTPEEVRRRLGNRMFAEKCGFDADEYAELRILWRKKGGTSCRDQEKGMFNTTDERLVAGGFSNWGDHAFANGTGMYDPANAKAKHDGHVAGGTTQGNSSKESVGHWMHTQLVNADINLKRVIDFVERNGHSVFDKGTGLKVVVEKLRHKFKQMVLTCVGRKPDTRLPFSSDELILIRDRIEASPKFKALAETKHFCFVPPNYSKASGTPCGCVHGKTHFKL